MGGFMFFLLVLIACIVGFKFWSSPKERYVRSVSAGKTPDQIKTIRYFVDTMFGKFTDPEYEQYVNSIVLRESSKETAMNKLGIDEDQVNEIEPLMMEGYDFNDNTYSKRVGNDWVSSAYQLTWLFFSAEQLYIYTRHFYMDETREDEDTQEYFYKDITAFKTGSKTVDQFDKLTNARSTVNTETFSIVVPGDTVDVALRNSHSLNDRIQGMKQLLREKKMQ